MKLLEIEANPNEYLVPEKSILIKTYAQINDRLFLYKAYFLLKPEKEVNIVHVSPSKKKSSANKKIIER